MVFESVSAGNFSHLQYQHRLLENRDPKYFILSVAMVNGIVSLIFENVNNIILDDTDLK